MIFFSGNEFYHKLLLIFFFYFLTHFIYYTYIGVVANKKKKSVLMNELTYQYIYLQYNLKFKLKGSSYLMRIHIKMDKL